MNIKLGFFLRLISMFLSALTSGEAFSVLDRELLFRYIIVPAPEFTSVEPLKIRPDEGGNTSTNATTESMSKKVEDTAASYPNLSSLETKEKKDELLLKSCGFFHPRQVIYGQVVGGEPIDNQNYPWLVSITFRYHLTCGGTIITHRFILTAAHCLIRLPIKHLKIKFFSEYLAINRTIIHPHFWRFGPDVALIQLVKPLNQLLVPVCVSRKMISEVGSPGLVIGRGYTKENGTPSKVLRSGRVQILPEHLCKKAYGKYFNTAYLCAGSPTGIPDTCTGDSGGPLLQKVGERWYQMGITSFGNGCGRAKFPGVYSRVQNVFGWIKSNINRVENKIQTRNGKTLI